jgi:hypothetical protein
MLRRIHEHVDDVLKIVPPLMALAKSGADILVDNFVA